MVSLCRNQQLGGKPPVLHRPPQGKAPFPRSAGRGRSGSTYIVYMQPRRPVGRHRDIGGPELPHNFGIWEILSTPPLFAFHYNSRVEEKMRDHTQENWLLEFVSLDSNLMHNMLIPAQPHGNNSTIIQICFGFSGIYIFISIQFGWFVN